MYFIISIISLNFIFGLFGSGAVGRDMNKDFIISLFNDIQIPFTVALLFSFIYGVCIEHVAIITHIVLPPIIVSVTASFFKSGRLFIYNIQTVMGYINGL